MTLPRYPSLFKLSSPILLNCVLGRVVCSSVSQLHTDIPFEKKSTKHRCFTGHSQIIVHRATAESTTLQSGQDFSLVCPFL